MTLADWIDEEKRQRDMGITRSLSPSQHSAVNARYPGYTLEYCCDCDGATGRAGRGDDSLFINDDGPYCFECYSEIIDAEELERDAS